MNAIQRSAQRVVKDVTRRVARALGPSDPPATWAPPTPLRLPLQEIEYDVRRLIAAAAEARRELAAAQRGHTAEVKALLLAFVEVADAFDRVLPAADRIEESLSPAGRSLVGNFRTISGLVRKQLREAGVAALGHAEEFDPQRHCAAEVVTDPALPDGTIVRELRKGYAWRGTVLRKTDVAVVSQQAGGSPIAEDQREDRDG